MLTDGFQWIASLWPGSVNGDDDVDRNLAFLGSELDGETVYRASYVTGVCLVLVAAAVVVASPAGGLVAIPCLVLATAVTFGGPATPYVLARAKRTRALGAAPSLVTRATLSMQLAPSPERAARFAAEVSDGALADSLDDHVRRADTSPRTGLQSFAREWRSWFPELERACSLVESAANVPAEQRSATLDRARTAVLDAARTHMANFAASIRGPATAVYAFGVLLPLALVSLLPALRAAGVPASIPLIVVVYDIMLPLGLLAASGWLLARRPVAFPPPTIDSSHPDVPTGRWRGPIVGLVAGGFSWLLAPNVLPWWLAPVAGFGVAVGTALTIHYRPETKVHESITAVESGLSDALALVGRRVERGESVESALPAVADELPGPTGDLFAEASRRQRQLGVGVSEAFLATDGALSTIPSKRARGAAALLAIAAREGQPAGEAVTAMADHLQELAAVEADAKRAVEQVTRTLTNTAAVFGPLVGGATVALAGVMGSSGPLTGGGTTAGLGLAVGAYVLVLAGLLTTLATGLERGFDRSLVGYRSGIAVLSATAMYLAAFVGTTLIV